ncbi:MAG: histidine kinase [Actinomycetaceae bacterium]|nr:histidine kinase [Actinomycetaceae bacterium]
MGVDNPQRNIVKERAMGLSFAVPYLLFLIPGYVTGVGDLPHVNAVWYLILETIFVVMYLLSWLMNDVAPLRNTMSVPQSLIYALLFVLAAGISLVSPSAGMYNLPYLEAVIILQIPWLRFYYALGFLTLFAVGILANGHLDPHTSRDDLVFAILIFLTSMVAIVLVRRAINQGRQSEIAAVQSKALAVEEERNRLASDLHDVLGQTLTAINTMAQLSEKLLVSGRINDARETMDSIATLSRDALTQTRAVVKSRQNLSIAEELIKARQLLNAAGVQCHIVGEPSASSEDLEDAIGHIVKEATANVVHHSSAHNCWIVLDEIGVSVSDDGRGPFDIADRATSQGTGLRALRERVEPWGTLSAGPQEGGRARGWTVRFRLNSRELDRIQ